MAASPDLTNLRKEKRKESDVRASRGRRVEGEGKRAVYLLGGGLHGLTGPSVDLLNEGIELALRKRKKRREEAKSARVERVSSTTDFSTSCAGRRKGEDVRRCEQCGNRGRASNQLRSVRGG